MNIGKMVTLNRAGGSGSVAIVEEDRIYQIELGPKEVKALDVSLVAGAPIRLEVAMDHVALGFVVHPWAGP